MLRTRRKRLNDKGMAVLEMIPVIIVVAVLLRYTYGFFGVIQSATVQSIAARNYAFETFRHRARLNYLRENTFSPDGKYEKGVRVHGIKDENSLSMDNPKWEVGRRNIIFPSDDPTPLGGNEFTARKNSQNNIQSGRANTTAEASPVWLAIRYGMCVDYNCGD